MHRINLRGIDRPFRKHIVALVKIADITRRCCLFLLVSLGTLNAEDRSFTRVEAIAELRELRTLIEASHPDPDVRSGGRLAFAREFQSILSGISSAETVTRNQLETAAAKVAALPGDGHTYLRRHWIGGGKPRFGIRFAALLDGLHVSQLQTGIDPSFLGARVVKIAGIDPQSLAERLSKQEAADNEIGLWLNLGYRIRSPSPLRLYRSDILQGIVPLSRSTGDRATIAPEA